MPSPKQICLPHMEQSNLEFRSTLWEVHKLYNWHSICEEKSGKNKNESLSLLVLCAIGAAVSPLLLNFN